VSAALLPSPGALTRATLSRVAREGQSGRT
jgi:hypothetical protein